MDKHIPTTGARSLQPLPDYSIEMSKPVAAEKLQRSRLRNLAGLQKDQQDKTVTNIIKT
jgi:hypothetical protein